MENKEIRRQNVLQLIEQCNGSVKEFADKAGMQPAQASHLKTGFRNVGDNLARRIERAFNKEVGWMDKEPTTATETTALALEMKHLKTVQAGIPEELLPLIEDLKRAWTSKSLSPATLRGLSDLVRSLQAGAAQEPITDGSKADERAAKETVNKLSKRIKLPKSQPVQDKTEQDDKN